MSEKFTIRFYCVFKHQTGETCFDERELRDWEQLAKLCEEYFHSDRETISFQIFGGTESEPGKPF